MQIDDRGLKSSYSCQKNMRKKLLIYFWSISLGAISITGLQGQSLESKARQIRTSLDQLDINTFMSLYADTVRYIDPNFGSDDRFPRATVRQFFEPIFAEGSTFDLKLFTIAIDEQEGSIMIRGDAYDQNEKGRLPFVVYFKFERGKIVRQIDFPVYAIESLRNAPRYKGYFKEKEGN